MTHEFSDFPQREMLVLAEEHSLKDLAEQELFDRLLLAGSEWTSEQRSLVEGAYHIGAWLHANDMHRDKPYVFHLLRNANRLVSYLHLTDPDSIAAALLHDSVEDHPEDILRLAMAGRTDELYAPVDLMDKQSVRAAALESISMLFSPQVSTIVEGMSNPLPTEGLRLNEDEKLEIYLSHLNEAIKGDINVFFNKLVDWGDNGLGIVHSNFAPNSDDPRRYKRKYSGAYSLLKARYYTFDVQVALDPVAKANVERMFVLADARLAA